jgi:Fe-coproporphyrin III synthase
MKLRPNQAPVDAVLAVTYRCNARCAMCGIWKSEPVPELPVARYARFPSSLRDVNLTGGEPFLRDDLPEVHAAVRRACPRAQTIISTNGLLTERIVEFMKQMRAVEPGIGAAVSLDGPQEVHDKLRGVPGAYDRALATVRLLQKEGFTNLRLAFTATASNARHMSAVYHLARDLGVEFTCAVEHTSEHYFHRNTGKADLAGEELRSQLEQVMRAELRGFSPKRWARAYFMAGLWRFAHGDGRPLPCRAGRDFFFMDPGGNIYTCNAMPFRMGNLAEREFDELWNSPDAAKARSDAAGCADGCWMICTARSAIIHAWPRALAWAIRAKLFGVRLPAAGGGK